MKDKLVSVIVTTKNEEKNIENCLKSITYQTYRNIEIIVVDNASSDRTKEIARKYTNLVFDKGPERSAQRNFGVGISKGKYILYLDADMILAKFVVESCINEIAADDKVVGLYIKEVILGKGLWSKVRRFERSFYDGTVIDAVRFVKKEAFLEAKGFDEEMSGPEDWDFDRKVSAIGWLKLLSKYKYLNNLDELENSFKLEIEKFLVLNGIDSKDLYIKYNNAIFHNETNITPLKYLNKKTYYMKNFNIYINKYGKNDIVIKKQFGLFYRYFRVFIENGKWKKLFRHPLLTIYMYFLKGAVGFLFAKHKLLTDR